MRILHLQETGLPDRRVERAAMLMKNNGHSVSFFGIYGNDQQQLGAFDEVKTLHPSMRRSTRLLRVILKSDMIDSLREQILDYDPDVIHAHNIVAAVAASRSGYPTVYDDHEWWSKMSSMYINTSDILRLPARAVIMLRMRRWEKEVVSKHPTFVTNERVAIEQRKKYPWVEPLNNYPLLSEIEHIRNTNGRKGLVYVGNDFSSPFFSRHRDMTGLRDVLDFDIVTGMTHRDMLNVLATKSVGLIPWRPVAFSWWTAPNKLYEYLHCGLPVVTNHQIKRGEGQDIPYVYEFRKQDYGDIHDAIQQAKCSDPDEIMEFAHKNFILDRLRETVMRAYEDAKK